MMPSPFPVDVLDNGLDWASFWVGLIAALATAGAVIVAIVQVAHARSDVKVARKDAADARADAKKEAALRRDAEATQSRNAERAAAERRADRQALAVVAEFGWEQFEDGRIVSGDLHAHTYVIVRNNSGHPIADVHVWQYCWFRSGEDSPRSYQPYEYPKTNEILAGSSQAFRPANGAVYVGHVRPHETLLTVVEFTDFYLDRWRLDWNGDLTLLTPRRIDVDAELSLQWSGRSDPSEPDGRPPLPHVLPEGYRDSVGDVNSSVSGCHTALDDPLGVRRGRPCSTDGNGVGDPCL